MRCTIGADLVQAPQHPNRSHSRDPWADEARCLELWDSCVGRMPREPLDAPEDLPKEASCQVAFGQLEGEVPRMPDEGPAGFEQPPLQARE